MRSIPFPSLVLALCFTDLIATPELRARHSPRAQEALVAKKTSTPTRQVLNLEHYGKWNRVTSTSLSSDGKWITYAYDPNDGDTTLFAKDLDDGAVRSITGGAGPRFSEDSRWLAYLVNPPEAETKKLRKQGKPVTQSCEVVQLDSDKKFEFASARSFAFAKSARFVAILKRRPSTKTEHRGADLLVVELATGSAFNIGNVAEYTFNESGTILAYVVDAAEKAGNGVYVRHLSSSRSVALDSAVARFEKLAFAESSNDVLYLKGDDVEGSEERANSLAVILDAGAESPRRIAYTPSSMSGFPDGFVLSQHTAPAFSKDRGKVFVGIREQRKKLDTKKKAKTSSGVEKSPRSNVEVWHWKDERLQSTQKVRAPRERRSTLLGVVHLDEKPRFVGLASREMTGILRSDNSRWVIGRDDSSYRGDMRFDRGRADYYRVDLETGRRSLLTSSIRRSLGVSPDGKWFLFSRAGEIFAVDVESGPQQSLSKLAGINFMNRQADRPTEKSVYGLAGFTKDGRGVILNHEFDLWYVPLDSAAGQSSDRPGAKNLTSGIGAQHKIRFRHVELDPEAKSIDTSAPMMLSAYGERTKKSGYYRWTPTTGPKPWIYSDHMIGSLRKAKSADRVMFSRQTFVESPNSWVASLSGTASPKRVTDANPQQAKFAWSPGRVLIDYTDKRGNELQATLSLPAGYEKGKQYPMLVYLYERMSQRHHQYSMPTYDDRPHMSTYASNGYLVLMPDIAYEDGKPGSSAVDDVGAAVRKVIELGYADPTRVGLQGHSWGGYQSSFMVTQMTMFACVVTGAPLTNLVSMHNVLYKRTGNANAGLIEWGQGRMATNPWENLSAYIEQSPVHHAEKIVTPFMILHGTADGAVDWNQGLEFYIAAKRLGKEVILLSYPDEPHHLRRKENQKDFQVRMQQYLDHYLKGAPAPAWMTKGLRYLDREREIRK